MRKIILLVCSVSSLAFAGASKETKANIAFLKAAVKKAEAQSILCKFNYKDSKGRAKSGSVEITFEMSEVDDTGMKVTSEAFSYGTDEVKEVLLDKQDPDKLVITYGEEGNYTLLTGYYHLIEDGSSNAFLTAENETVDTGGCELAKAK